MCNRENSNFAVRRRRYFYEHPDNKDAKVDSAEMVRARYFYNHPNDEDASMDVSDDIRLRYYELHLHELS